MTDEDEIKLDTFLYVVNNTKDQPCILANMSINFMISHDEARIKKYKNHYRLEINVYNK